MANQSQSNQSNRKNKNFTNLSNVLPKVMRALGIDKRLREHTFIKLWPHIVGEPFASRARPLFIDYEGNLVVAVRDAVVGQEFGFARAEVLKKLRHSARGLNIEINGLRFDMKRFFEGQDELAQEAYEKRLPVPTDHDLDVMELSPEDQSLIDAVGESSKSQALNGEAFIDRMRSLYEKELRLKRWREANGYPHCSHCGEVTGRLHGTDLICALCFATGMSNKNI